MGYFLPFTTVRGVKIVLRMYSIWPSDNPDPKR